MHPCATTRKGLARTFDDVPQRHPGREYSSASYSAKARAPEAQGAVCAIPRSMSETSRPKIPHCRWCKIAVLWLHPNHQGGVWSDTAVSTLPLFVLVGLKR
jgi:hypothetical protein